MSLDNALHSLLLPPPQATPVSVITTSPSAGVPRLKGAILPTPALVVPLVVLPLLTPMHSTHNSTVNTLGMVWGLMREASLGWHLPVEEEEEEEALAVAKSALFTAPLVAAARAHGVISCILQNQEEVRPRAPTASLLTKLVSFSSTAII